MPYVSCNGSRVAAMYYVDDTGSKLFYGKDIVSLEALNQFNKEKNLYFDLYVYDDTNKKMYVVCSDFDYKKHYIFGVIKNRIELENYFFYQSYQPMGVFACNNGNILFQIADTYDDFCIVNLQMEKERIVNLEYDNVLGLLVDYKNNKIFYDNAYYDCTIDKFIPLKEKLKYARPDSQGTRLVGISDDDYLAILNLKTGTLQKLNIKRLLRAKKYRVQGLYYLDGNTLFYSQDYSLTILDDIGELMMGLPQYAMRDWYKLDLLTGKSTKIQTPTNRCNLNGCGRQIP
ncbi:MAG: hypothetical protein P1P64_00440 [Treponemataceae bacterium]